MTTVIWTSRSLKDLVAIGEYIGADSETAAKKFIKEIISKAEVLSFHPLKGRPIPENIPGKYRQIYIKIIELFTK
jgi:plasmid stabilization system protein ParE